MIVIANLEVPKVLVVLKQSRHSAFCLHFHCNVLSTEKTTMQLFSMIYDAGILFLAELGDRISHFHHTPYSHLLGVLFRRACCHRTQVPLQCQCWLCPASTIAPECPIHSAYSRPHASQGWEAHNYHEFRTHHPTAPRGNCVLAQPKLWVMAGSVDMSWSTLHIGSGPCEDTFMTHIWGYKYWYRTSRTLNGASVIIYETWVDFVMYVFSKQLVKYLGSTYSSKLHSLHHKTVFRVCVLIYDAHVSFCFQGSTM